MSSRSPSRTSWWSSAIRTFGGELGHADASPVGMRSRIQRAGGAGGLDFEGSADGHRSFEHARESAAHVDVWWRDSATVIGDA